MAGLNDAPFVRNLAIPAVIILILFLAYSSQYLFHTAADLDPGPPTPRETLFFNGLLAGLWFTYYKSCTVDPGRYEHHAIQRAPRKEGKRRNSDEEVEDSDKECKACERVTDSEEDEKSGSQALKATEGRHAPGTRWCRKCAAPKPPRAHHCRTCATCVPRMDHHCPWTANCVSLTTFPHFLRFLAYTNLSLWTLSYFLYQRFAHLWASRALPAYLGPSLASLIHLTLLTLVNFFTSLALGILFASTVKNWLFNMTTIEGWELDKHEAHFEPGKEWYDDGDGARIERVEFPYDVGILQNMAQAMGTRNILLWLFPFAPTPRIDPQGSITGRGTGWRYDENGFNPRPGMWPPADPERLRRSARRWPGSMMAADDDDGTGAALLPRYASAEEEKAAFRRRQELDMQRWRGRHQRERIMAELEEVDDYDVVGYDEHSPSPMAGPDLKLGWANSDGERLGDYGVDEEAEEDIPLAATQSDDDVPLGELIRRRRGVRKVDE